MSQFTQFLAQSRPKLIDSTQFMYQAFQNCRHVQQATTANLIILIEMLEIVEQKATLVIEVPAHWVEINHLHDSVIKSAAALRPGNSISAANQKLFSLVYIGAHELQGLWADESLVAVRRLGYAFHIIPDLLWTPEKFNPEWYMFCFRLVSGHWGKLSLRMQQAFCIVLGLSMEETVRLVNSTGFAIDS